MKPFLFFILILLAHSCTAMDQDKLIELKNGNFVDQTKALEIHHNAKTVQKENSIAFYDLIHKCKNPDYKYMSEDSIKVLQQFRLIGQNGPSELVKKVIENGTVGQEFIIKLIWPFKETKKNKDD